MSTFACLTITACLALAPGANAAEPSVPPVGHPFRLQPGDAVARPIDPVEARSPADQDRLDALAWFGVGKLHENRGDYRKALVAYRKAVELDPEAVAVYRRLVPLGFSLGENEAALEHALRLVDLAPDDVNLMEKISEVLVSRGQIGQAAALLEKALSVKSLAHDSAQFVALNRDLGMLYFATGKTEKAADAFEVFWDGLQHPDKYDLNERQIRILLADPESTFERLGQTFLAAKRTKLAMAAFRRASESRDEQSGILDYNLARVHLAAGEPKKALARLEDSIESGLTDRGRAVYDLLKTVLAKLKRDDEFVSRMREIVHDQPDNYAAKLVLADERFERGKLDEAAQLYKAALEAKTEPTGLLGLARIARKQGEGETILMLLARAQVAEASDQAIAEELAEIATEKSLTDTILSQARANAEKSPPQTNFASAVLAGKLAIEAKRLDDADFFYHVAARIRPDRKAALFAELGVGLMIAEDLPAAIAVLREGLESAVNDGQRLNLMYRLSQALEFDHKTDEALTTIEQALNMAPQVPLLQFQRAWIHFHAAQLDKAETLFQDILKQFPQNREIVRQTRLSLSALYVQQGDLERGEQVLEVIYAEDPDNVAVCNDLGYLYADQGKKLDQAERMIRKAVAAEPENAAYLDSLGWVLYQTGQYKEALKPLKKAVDQPQGDDATIWNHLGDVYQKLDRSEEARKAWKHALERLSEDERPNEELAEELTEKLKKSEE